MNLPGLSPHSFAKLCFPGILGVEKEPGKQSLHSVNASLRWYDTATTRQVWFQHDLTSRLVKLWDPPSPSRDQLWPKYKRPIRTYSLQFNNCYVTGYVFLWPRTRRESWLELHVILLAFIKQCIIIVLRMCPYQVRWNSLLLNFPSHWGEKKRAVLTFCPQHKIDFPTAVNDATICHRVFVFLWRGIKNVQRFYNSEVNKNMEHTHLFRVLL